ncbi:MAG: Acg family FMN-binding oxidoreductase [Aestuariivirga sp.]
MMTRKAFIGSAAVLAAASLAYGFRSTQSSDENYEIATRETWRRADVPIASDALLKRELVRYATLAPSSHNTQCWKFRIEQSSISILPDLSRRCPAVDPDDHHLFVSLGCAAENLLQAAGAHGLSAQPDFDPATGEIAVALRASTPFASPLFQAVTERQCTRSEFDGTAISPEELRALEQAGAGNGVQLILLTGKKVIEEILEYVVAGNSAQIADHAFVDELKAWIRFGKDEAVRTRDGLFSGSSGNASMPRWMGSRLFDMFFIAKSENEKCAKQLRSSAGVAVFLSESDDKAHWIEAGRCYQRFALQATALGIRNALINQPVEVAALRPQLAAHLGIGSRRPDLIARFGRGPVMPRSLRRPIDDVLS